MEGTLTPTAALSVVIFSLLATFQLMRWSSQKDLSWSSIRKRLSLWMKSLRLRHALRCTSSERLVSRKTAIAVGPVFLFGRNGRLCFTTAGGVDGERNTYRSVGLSARL